MILVRKLRIYAMLMRLQELEQEKRSKIIIVIDPTYKGLELKTEIETFMLTARPPLEEIFMPKESNRPNKHRNKRPFHN